MTQNSFASVWDAAGDAAESQESLRAMASAQAQVRDLWPFFALAQSPEDFDNRVALADDRLIAAAGANGVTIESLVSAQRAEWDLLAEARAKTAGDKNAWGTDKDDVGEGFCPDCEREDRADGSRQHYDNCPQHAKNRQASKTAKKCEDCNGTGAVPALGHEHPSQVDNGYAQCPNCGGHGVEEEPDGPGGSDDRTAYERYGDAGPGYRDAGDEQDDWYGRFSSLKTALEEGVDPLSWLEAEDGGQGVPEVAGGHVSTPAATSGPSAGAQIGANAAKVANSGIVLPKEGEEAHYESEGIPFTVGYHSWQAEGDDGRPAKGYTKGVYTVTDALGNAHHFSHTPHGPGLEGARPAAGQAAVQHMHSQWSKAKSQRLFGAQASRGRHPFGEPKTAVYVPEHILNAIRNRDPDGGSREPTKADYDAHRNWAVNRFGQDAWDRYSDKSGWGHQPGDDPRHVESSRGRRPFA